MMNTPSKNKYLWGATILGILVATYLILYLNFQYDSSVIAQNVISVPHMQLHALCVLLGVVGNIAALVTSSPVAARFSWIAYTCAIALLFIHLPLLWLPWLLSGIATKQLLEHATY